MLMFKGGSDRVVGVTLIIVGLSSIMLYRKLIRRKLDGFS